MNQADRIEKDSLPSGQDETVVITAEPVEAAAPAPAAAVSIPDDPEAIVITADTPYPPPVDEFPKEVHNLLVTAQTAHVELSSMADTKASILMGAAFVVFALAIDKVASGEPTLSLLLLTLFSFVSTVLSVLAIRPKIIKPPRYPRAGTNLLFFGGFTGMKEDEYVEHIIHVMRREETTYRAMARDLYQNGQVLQNKKYKYLSHAYTLFLAGLVATCVAVILELWIA